MQLQEGRYREAIGALDRRPKLLHTSNSAAIARSEASSYDLVRPGVFLYGGLAGDTALVTPEPVAHLRAPIVDVREVMQGETVSYGGTWKSPGKSRIATAAVGYADGYRRNFGNRATAIVKGRRVPVTGTVTMDMTMLDVSGVDCDVGDVVTLLGRDGDDCIGADELAQHAGIISYELLVGLRLRAERVYVGGGAA
jgi:alanine racemase